MLSYLFAALLAAQPQALPPQSQPPTTTIADALARSAKAGRKPKLDKDIYCAEFVPLGSHITVKKCQTLDEWAWDAYQGEVQSRQAITFVYSFN